MNIDDYAKEKAEKLIDQYIQCDILIFDDPTRAYLKREHAINLARMVIKLGYLEGQSIQLEEDINKIKLLK
jgi:hypothetical protein